MFALVNYWFETNQKGVSTQLEYGLKPLASMWKSLVVTHYLTIHTIEEQMDKQIDSRLKIKRAEMFQRVFEIF